MEKVPDPGKIIIGCPACKHKLRIPDTSSKLVVKCPDCSNQFYYPFWQSGKKTKRTSRRRFLKGTAISIPFVLIAIVVGFIFSNNLQHTSPETIHVAEISKANVERRDSVQPIRSNWIKIPYGGLVDRTTITHPGDTVGEIIQRIPREHYLKSHEPVAQ
jgi:hypothetical protein